MKHNDYPPEEYQGRRSTGILAAIITSIITSAVVTSALLIVTGNMPGLQNVLGSAAAVGQSASPGPYIKVPKVVGLPTDSAVDLLRARKLRMVVEAQEPSDTVDKGVIIQQEPLPESELEENAQVAVVVSSGTQKASVPEVLGKKLEEAQAAVLAAGLVLGEVSQTGVGEEGTVTKVTPLPGALLEKGSAVSLVVVPQGIEVPDVLGQRTAQAKKTIKNAGLTVGKIRWRYNEHRPANLVLAQDPEPGTMIPLGASVDLVLNEE